MPEKPVLCAKRRKQYGNKFDLLFYQRAGSLHSGVGTIVEVPLIRVFVFNKVGTQSSGCLLPLAPLALRPSKASPFPLIARHTLKIMSRVAMLGTRVKETASC